MRRLVGSGTTSDDVLCCCAEFADDAMGRRSNRLAALETGRDGPWWHGGKNESFQSVDRAICEVALKGEGGFGDLDACMAAASAASSRGGCADLARHERHKSESASFVRLRRGFGGTD